MFDLKQPQGQGAGTPSSPNKTVEDMFSGTDPLKRAGRPSPFVVKNEPVASVPPSQTALVMEEDGGGRSARFGGKGVLAFVVVVVVVGIAVGAAAFFLTKKNSQTPSFNINELSGSNTPLGGAQDSQAGGASGLPNVNASPIGSENRNQEPFANVNQEPLVHVTRNVNRDQVNANIPVPEPLDRDGDGLTLEQEGELGTSDNLSDTDLDGLSDWDEVKVHRSDPLDPDTDGDGYVDGSEVKKGYSPIINGE